MEALLKKEKQLIPHLAGKPEMLVCKDIRKVYPTPKGDYVVLDDLHLSIKKGEFVSIIGHSGCGKSTLLTMIAGLNEISGGNVIVDHEPIRGAGPDRAVVFQSPSLLPWLTALQNVMIGVNQVFPKATKAEKNDICKYYLNKVGLGNDFNKKATSLSQGMQQRVGIARAFALKPKILLLDEPFGMLDSLTRGELQDVLLEIWQKEKITAVAITHDVDESIFLADRVIMMTSGPYAKIGDELIIPFERPRNRKDVLEHPEYYDYRGYLMDFLNH
ncbi:ABC transporter ATP-binding protein [Echinicola jeungdonensis]|uniref:ABC transporter ATP-binding protein n=1 Tax=Echinicola jeungdonensis TaxID=709343 RepID=A0ABV5J951_9BACT|nr:ABC transporter ATP-binding protein [Echinicola jeungdonensis]MDN3669142.1 ABC transporter ATP-binding protein [Echinicola jeungdonensis]